jgi:hypothetical protein
MRRWPPAERPRSGMPTMLGLIHTPAMVAAVAASGRSPLGSGTSSEAMPMLRAPSAKPVTSAASAMSQRSAENMEMKISACDATGSSMPVPTCSFSRAIKAR